MPFLDDENSNNGNNPSLNNIDHNRNSDRQSLDNKDCDEDDKRDIETESDSSKISAYISEENDELTDDDKEFEESEMTKISDGIVITVFIDCNFDRILIFIYFR